MTTASRDTALMIELGPAVCAALDEEAAAGDMTALITARTQAADAKAKPAEEPPGPVRIPAKPPRPGRAA